MTCTHVLGLIDAGPFADYPRAHLDAAWQHARQCATCGPALEAAAALTADLAALPQPAPPPDLTAIVLARIARIEQADPAPAAAAMPEKALSTRDRSAWASALGGLAAGLAIVLSTAARRRGVDRHRVAQDQRDHRWSGRDVLDDHGALVLAAGLVLYVAGLFAPLGGRSRGS